MVFADDSASVLISLSGSAAETAELLLADDLLFDTISLEGGWAQNRAKKDIVASLPPGANRQLQEALLQGCLPQELCPSSAVPLAIRKVANRVVLVPMPLA